MGEGRVGCDALERADRNRLASLVLEHAGALAEHLDRADARTGATEQVFGEDRPGGAGEVTFGDRADEPRHVDVGRAGDRAGRGRVGPAAVEAAVSLDERLVALQRRAQLTGERGPRDLRRDFGHAPILADATRCAIGGDTEPGCGKPPGEK